MGRNRKLDETEAIVRWAVQTTRHPVLRIALMVVRVLAGGEALESRPLPARKTCVLSAADRNKLVELAAQCVSLLVMAQTVKPREAGRTKRRHA